MSQTQTTTIHRKRWHEQNERYDFDFNRCKAADGWAQCDTKQDASYFGTWANPIELWIMSFCEGDCTLSTASSPEEFAAEIRSMAEWNIEHGWGFAIDGMCRDKIIDGFRNLGLGDLLH